MTPVTMLSTKVRNADRSIGAILIDAGRLSSADAERIRQKLPDEALTGISPRFVINSLSNAIVQSAARSHGHTGCSSSTGRCRAAPASRAAAPSDSRRTVDRAPSKGCPGPRPRGSLGVDSVEQWRRATPNEPPS